MCKITQMGVRALSDKLVRRELSALETTGLFLSEIERKNAELGAFLTIAGEQAKSAAEEIDQRRIAGECLHPLAGIPFGVKDNICTNGVKTTCGSRMLSDFMPVYDAAVIERLYACGGILLGKQNMDEFGMGSSTEHSYFRVTRNPADITRIPGGSSGGSAAAVAAEMVPFSIGSDTGGSIRQPAAMCGVVGFKPTYGSVSRYGLIAFASSLDQIGVLARNVSDTALVFTAIAGKDKRDFTSRECSTAGLCNLHPEIAGMKIALPKEYFSAAVSPSVKEAVLRAAAQYARMGAVVEEVSMPLSGSLDALAAYYVISSAEASSNLARYDGVRFGYRTADYTDIEDLYCKSRSDGFGSEVKRRILLGTFILTAEEYAGYQKAMQVKRAICREFSDIFTQFDLILTPTAPHTAWKFGEKQNPTEMYMEDLCTVPASIAGLPALSICCGRDEAGLPIGMQLIGRAFDEYGVLQAGYAYELTQGVTR